MSLCSLKRNNLITQPKLPAPDSFYKKHNVTFEVYRAKNLYSQKWRHPSLHKLVSASRTSYQRYGLRALFDKYDNKAAIYLIRAQYHGKKLKNGNARLINEWLSVRMVPGDGKFNGVGELELYNSKNTPVVELLQQKMHHSRSKFWHYVI